MSKSRSDNSERFSEMFKALSNPHRLKIFVRLARCCGPGVACDLHSEQMKKCVGQLGRNLGIAPSTISHHVKELHRAGLVHMQRRGKNIDCWVDPDVLGDMACFFEELQGSPKVVEPPKTKRRK